MSTVIYVISDPLNESVGRYKVGLWSRNKESLITRYITYHPEMNIHYFVETNKAFDVESIFKENNKDKRVKNIRGRRSEWFVMPLAEIIQQLDYLISVDIETIPIYQPIKIFIPLIYLDNFNHPPYDEIGALDQVNAKTLRQKFKQEGLTKDEAGLLD